MKIPHPHPFATAFRRFLPGAALAALAILPATHSYGVAGAAITWGAPTNIAGDTDVSTAGTLLYAYAVGATGVPGATVNGVTFSPFALTQSGTIQTVGNVTLSAPNGFDASNTGFGSSSAPFTNLSSSYKSVLSGGNSPLSATGSESLSLGGLTSGQTYQIEIWANESQAFENSLSTLISTKFTATNTATLQDNTAGATGGEGQWVTGTFTANSASNTITITQGSAGEFTDLNAFEVRNTSAPEPASLAILAVGGIPLLMRRRRACEARAAGRSGAGLGVE